MPVTASMMQYFSKLKTELASSQSFYSSTYLHAGVAVSLDGVMSRFARLRAKFGEAKAALANGYCLLWRGMSLLVYCSAAIECLHNMLATSL